jgi:hypothetical protein
MQLALAEQEQLELAARVAGITYVMYVPSCHLHPSGLLHRRDPTSRLAVWNPLQNDGDLFRLALAVPDVDLNKVMTEARSAGGDVARRVRKNFVQAVTEKVQAEDRARPRGPAQTEPSPGDMQTADAKQAASPETGSMAGNEP